MKTTDSPQSSKALEQLCTAVRAFVADKNYDSCIEQIRRAMEQFPHAPQPHNLLGIVLEKQGNHPAAMKHFRAAWALDPTYLPAYHNLNTFGAFFTIGRCAFDESDLPSAAAGSTKGRSAAGHVQEETLKLPAIRSENGIQEKTAAPCVRELSEFIPTSAGVQITEVRITGVSPAAGKKLWEISLPAETIVCCILRSDTALVPRGDTRIHAGDTLIVITGSGREKKAVQVLTGRS